MPRRPATQAQSTQPSIQISDPVLDAVKAVDDRIGKFAQMFNWVVGFVIGIMAIGFLTLLFALGGMMIQAWQYNATVYREQKTAERDEQILELQKLLKASQETAEQQQVEIDVLKAEQ